MWILTKLRRFYVKNVGTNISNSSFTLDRSLDFFPEQENLPIYPSQSLHVKAADTLTQNFCPNKEKPWTNYSGLQEEIYD